VDNLRFPLELSLALAQQMLLLSAATTSASTSLSEEQTQRSPPSNYSQQRQTAQRLRRASDHAMNDLEVGTRRVRERQRITEGAGSDPVRRAIVPILLVLVGLVWVRLLVRESQPPGRLRRNPLYLDVAAHSFARGMRSFFISSSVLPAICCSPIVAIFGARHPQ
jgi:uncharacterized protein YjiS (DUF1127 family)